MPSSHATVSTDRSGRYAKQLISHLTRRATGEWHEDDGRGWLELGSGRAELVAAPTSLDIRVEGTDVALLENVVGRHLVRFGAKDELAVDWIREDGTAGTSYRNSGEE